VVWHDTGDGRAGFVPVCSIASLRGPFEADAARKNPVIVMETLFPGPTGADRTPSGAAFPRMKSRAWAVRHRGPRALHDRHSQRTRKRQPNRRHHSNTDAWPASRCLKGQWRAVSMLISLLSGPQTVSPLGPTKLLDFYSWRKAFDQICSTSRRSRGQTTSPDSSARIREAPGNCWGTTAAFPAGPVLGTRGRKRGGCREPR